MAWNRSEAESENWRKPTKKHHVGIVVAAALLAVAAVVVAVQLISFQTTTGSADAIASEADDDSISKPKKAKLISEVVPAEAPVWNVVAEKLQTCDFLLNRNFKQNAKVYLCLFSASWCPPCRMEMPRIAKIYAENLQSDPHIELIHFSRDQDDSKAMAWAKKHDVKFPVVKPKGGNPLDLHTRGIPHLFIIKADGTLVEEGHPMSLFTMEKIHALK